MAAACFGSVHRLLKADTLQPTLSLAHWALPPLLVTPPVVLPPTTPSFPPLVVHLAKMSATVALRGRSSLLAHSSVFQLLSLRNDWSRRVESNTCTIK